MLSGGRLPFQGDPKSPGTTTREKIAWEQVDAPLPNLREYNPDLPEAVITAVEKALKKEPRQRYATAIEFSGAFEEARGSAGAWQYPSSPPDRTSGQVSPSLPLNTDPITAHASPQLPAPHLYARSGVQAEEMIPIPRDGLTIGRGTNSELRLSERSVSRQHASLIWAQGRVYVRDENSSLGTFVNGEKVPAQTPIPLKDGDVIQTGYDQLFEFRMK